MDRYAFTAALTSLTPIGLVPAGLRMDVGFTGEVTDGPLAGATLTGVDHMLLRPDGVGVIDARELAGTEDGRVVALRAEGFVVPPFPMPELAVIAAPGFEWPDVDLPLHGSARLEAADPGLAAVNATVYAFTGTANLATGRLRVVAEAIPALAAARV